MSKLIHPTAVIDAHADLEPDVVVGPFAVVEPETYLGRGCRIGAHAVIKSYTRLGESNQVFEGAVLGGIPQDLKFQGSQSFLEIGVGNVIREGVTIHRSATPGGATPLDCRTDRIGR